MCIKGSKLYVEGKIRTRSYDDQTGAKRYVTEIFVDSMEMLSPRGTAAPGAAAQQPGMSQGAPAQPMAQSQATPAQDNTTDDLPF